MEAAAEPHGWRRTARAGVVIDERAEQAAARMRNRYTLAGARAAGRLGDGGIVWVLTLAWLGRRSPRRVLEAIGVLALGALVVNVPVKRLVDRERPEPLAGGGNRPYGSSFPSGHAFTSFLVAVMLPGGRAAKILGALGASVVSASRVHERHHHATDVLAGAALGAACGALARRIVRWQA